MTSGRAWVYFSMLLGSGFVLGYLVRGPGKSVTPPVAPAVAPEYFAEQSADCGVELLNLSPSESGPFTRVLPVGSNLPHERLRRGVWQQGRYRLQGRFTGETRSFSECASFPVFEVTGFRPWVPVQRCASPGAADPGMLFYTGDLPVDRYVPEDFIDGPDLPFIDDTACRHIGACQMDKRHPSSRPDPRRVIDGYSPPASDARECHPEVQCEQSEKRVHACSGDVWCCPLVPVRNEARPSMHEP